MKSEQLGIIGLTIVFSIAFISMAISDYQEREYTPAMLERDYEQCPKYGAGETGELIWVKSCKEYTASIKDE